MPQAIERLLATPMIRPRLPRMRPLASAITPSPNAGFKRGIASLERSMARPRRSRMIRPQPPISGGPDHSPAAYDIGHASLQAVVPWPNLPRWRRPVLTPIDDADAPDMAGPEAGGRDIERALSTLVTDQRSALLLVVLEGLSYREVAEVQGVPIGTVMSRLARARAQMKAYLDGERPPLRRIK